MTPKPDTPPASPGFGPEAMNDEDDVIEDNMVEVIDLDDEDSGNEVSGNEDLLPEDNSTMTFKGHGKAVFSIHFHPKNPEIVVSGGEDDRAYVWNAKSGEILMQTPIFKDSVIFTKFNNDGAFLALADMAGNIKIYKVADGVPKDQMIWTFETSDLTVSISSKYFLA